MHSLHRTIYISVLSFSLGYMFHSIFSDNASKQYDLSHTFSSSHLQKPNMDTFLVVLIFSGLHNTRRRETIRNTWMSDIQGNRDVVCFFVIGAGAANDDQKKLLNLEQEKFSDILLFPYLNDSFHSLTKKLLVSVGWLMDVKIKKEMGVSPTKKSFDGFLYLLKCDDDSFVRVNEIIKELKHKFPGKKGENLYWGFFDGRAKPAKTGKYKETEWVICDCYLPYALGGGYVLSYNLVSFLAKNLNFLKAYINEDVSVGAWLSSYADLHRVHDTRFDTEYTSRGCHDSYLITHKKSEISMKYLHDNLREFGHLCKTESRSRLSYIYNWAVPPSKCCARNDPNIP